MSETTWYDPLSNLIWLEIVTINDKEDYDLNKESNVLVRARQICADYKMVGEFYINRKDQNANK